MKARAAHVEILDGPCHVELVYGADDDGGSCEEGQQEEHGEVDHHVSHKPVESSHREVVPMRRERQNSLKS